MKARNMIGERSGRPVANQFIVEDFGKVYFQSYESLIAVVQDNRITLGGDWNYSRTTLKYLYAFMREYVPNVWRKLPEAKSGAESIRKGITCGLISYDPYLQ